MKQRSDGVTIIALYQFIVAFLSLLGICGLLSIPVIVAASTAAARAEGGPLATAIVSTVMVVASGWLFLTGLANAIIGWGLWKQREWGRIGTIVLAVFRLLNFPLGTLIGALIIWYLLRQDVKAEFRPEPAAPQAPAASQLPLDLDGAGEAGEPAPAPPAPPREPEG
jgi:hypothetical protein